MAVQALQSAAVASGSQTYALSTFFTITASANPAYLVVSALDRDEYPVGSTRQTGTFTGGGKTLSLSPAGGDARAAGIVFTYNATAGGYVSDTYGALSNLSYVSSGSKWDLCNVSLYGCSTLSQAQQLASSPYAAMQLGAAGYAGSVSFVTDPTIGGAARTEGNATPGRIAEVASRFVGQAWHSDGCWILASTIAAEAGAGLPVTSTAVGIKAFAAGSPWMVAYNGPATASNSWQSLVRTGDIVSFSPGGSGGHIATCVSGAGSSAMLIDNITYGAPGGGIANPANDGSPNDILVAAAHPASQEFAGTPGSSVVIYRLDTPVVSALSSGASVSAGGTIALSTLVSAVDPAGKPITRVQAYTSSSTDKLAVAGKATLATGLNTAVTGTSLSGVTLLAGAPGSDTIYVRAGNAAWWGDWQAVKVTVAAAPPRLVLQTPNIALKSGQAFSWTVPTGTFVDPNGQALTYSVAGKGAALPQWLSFDAKTGTLAGTVPLGGATIPVVLTATDTANLSASETFTLTVPNAAPVLAAQTPAQTWALGGAVNFALPANTFTDPQGLKMSFVAAPANGGALPGWLRFNGGTGVFSGTAPTAQAPLSIKITATDTVGLSASEIFSVSFAKTAAGALASAGAGLPEPFQPLPVGGWHGSWAQATFT